MKASIIFSFLFSLSSVAEQSSKEVISEEIVSIILTKDAITCSDKVYHDRDSFTPGIEPGRLSIYDRSVIDKTRRVIGYYFFYELPDTIDCAALATSIASIPSDIRAKREVSRIVTRNTKQVSAVSNLLAVVTIELSIPELGGTIVLESEQTWLEQNPYDDVTLPKQSTYIAHTHPRSASAPVGLFCAEQSKGLKKYTLGFGQFSGFFRTSNLDVVTTSPFESQAQCEDARNDLMQQFAAEDPDNWGSRFLVNRKIESRYRFIRDNQANGMCQEIILETIAVDVHGYKFTAIGSSFPLRTVDIEQCGSQG